jgi:N-acetylmuramic acid 6-phosphate (MurNAc-6-P) etherase
MSIVATVAHIDYDPAMQLLQTACGSVKGAFAMAVRNTDRCAERLLREHRGSLGAAIGEALIGSRA